MELKTFIKQSLIDIATAVKEANEDKSTEMIVNPNKIICAGNPDQRISKEDYSHDRGTRYVQNIKFDVAVSVGNSVSGGTDKNINIADANIGESTETNDDKSATSRIQFELPIALPHGQY